MKTLVCREPGTLELELRTKPETAPEGWVLIDVKFVGLCGTDYHIFEGLHPFLQYPRVMGHELGGTVVRAAGAFKAGDQVIINPYIACGKCRACQKGKPNCCYNISVLGVHSDGGLCERIVVPLENLYPANGLKPEHAAMVEFMSIGAHAVSRSDVTKGDRALVVGVGPIGLGTALFAQLNGADVHLLDFSEERLSMAQEKFGFTKAFSGKHSPEDILKATNGDGFDVVFDATGNQVAMQAGFKYVAHGGTFVLVSVVNGDVTFSDPEFHKREMRLIGSRNALQADFDRVMTAFKTGTINADLLNTHSTTLEGLPGLMDEWTHSRDTMIKAIVTV